MTEKTEEPIRRPKRWSASRKMEVVVRCLRGESLDNLSREIGVAATYPTKNLSTKDSRIFSSDVNAKFLLQDLLLLKCFYSNNFCY
ncbi:MAG: hypothetical protein K1000chlam2_01673 [Chlamydiae bacterium]|nr:hypothetical protein [Chlamydiota bacterium]